MSIENYEFWEKTSNRLDDNWKSYNKLSVLNIKCKNCGHTIFPQKERMICTHCGYWVYKNDKVEFKYKFKEIAKKH